MVYESVTDGEKLCRFIEHDLLANSRWEALASCFKYTGRQLELTDFFRQLTIVNLAGRLVIGGSSLAKQMDISDPQFQMAFMSFLRDNLEIPYYQIDETYRFALRAVKASQEQISKSLARKIKNWAKIHHKYCYMCGDSLDFHDSESHCAYTCEHIWPRSYGGNSIEDNLLPACQSCNSHKKGHFATWAMPAIQSLIMGFEPSSQRLQEIEGCHKFALHYRIAQKLAERKNLTLKQAFLKLGHWTEVRITRLDDVADFFNLENYQL